MDLDLDALEVLEAIVEEGSFSAAARRLHRAQSAISYAVGRLEAGLDLQLFDRSGHRAVLTDAGRTVLEEGRLVLRQARELQAIARRIRGGWEPTLRVVLDGVLPLRPLLPVLQALADPSIPTRVDLQMAFLSGVQERFEASNADLMVGKVFRPSPHLEAEALAAREVWMVCSAEHVLAASERVDRQMLESVVELIIGDTGPAAEDQTPTVERGRLFRLSDFHAKKAALLAGLGFGWMPRGLVEDEVDEGALAVVPWEEDPRRLFTPWMVWRRDRPPGKAGLHMMDAVRDVLGPQTA